MLNLGGVGSILDRFLDHFAVMLAHGQDCKSNEKPCIFKGVFYFFWLLQWLVEGVFGTVLSHVGSKIAF